MQKDTYKKLIGLLLALLVYFLMKGNVDDRVARTAGITVLMAIWWVSEATHLSITALLPLILFPLTGVLGMKEVLIAMVTQEKLILIMI